MSNNTQSSPVVSLEVAKRLAKYYPQDNAQVVWAHPKANYVDRYRPDTTDGWYIDSSGGVYGYAAPSHLQALMFLEQEMGYAWIQDGRGIRYHHWVATPLRSNAVLEAKDPDSLIMAILDHLERDEYVADPSRSVQRRVAAQRDDPTPNMGGER